MYEFLDRLCNVVLLRVRDFRGLPPNAFDGRGNYTLGLKDQLVFPEIDYTRVDKIKGMNITLTTTASNDEEGRELLKLLEANNARAGRDRKELEQHRNSRRNDGARFTVCQDGPEAEVQDTRAQPLPPVRAPARLPAKISDVPHPASRQHPARGDSRRGEGQLVGALINDYANRSHF